MIEYAHGFRMNEDACDGCLACMRACPTCAIRVKHEKASVQAELCIDCGSCLKACTRGAIIATTQTLEEFAHFAFKVAIPSPVLFGQFPLEVPPAIIARGLLAAGFDAVWDYGVDLALGAARHRRLRRALAGRPSPRQHDVPGHRPADPGLLSAHGRTVAPDGAAA